LKLAKWSDIEANISKVLDSIKALGTRVAEIASNSAFSWRVRAITTAQRDVLYPNPFDGLIIVNTTLNQYQVYYNGGWNNAGALGAIDHGADLVAASLLDNDHPQYVNAVGDTASVDMTLAGQSISGVVLPAGVDHAQLNNLNSANYTHLTAVNHTDLTDGGDTALHYHSAAGATHTHSKLVASDGAPDPAISTDASGNVTAVARLLVDDTTDATNTTNGSIQTDGGLSVVKRIVAGDDIAVLADNKNLELGAGSDMSMYYDGTNGNIDTDIVAASDLTIDCGAAKTVVLETPVYDDLQFAISAGKVPAANYPDYEAFGTQQREYSFDVNDYIDLQANELPHGWVEGSTAEFHLHLWPKTAQNTGANRFAKFTLYISYADTNEVLAETSLTAEYTIPDGTAALTHLLLDLGNLALPNNLIGTQIKLRIKRIAATGGTEYADSIFITQVGSHVQHSRLGSRTEYAA
jgi:hypothetical protein